MNLKDEKELNILFNKASNFFGSIAADCQSEELLKFYSLYKQAVIGSCDTPRPGFFDLKGKQKWDAWNALGDMAQDRAMELYIEKLGELSPNWEEEAVNFKSSWVSVSRMLPEKDIKSEDKTLFHFIQENNLTKVKDFSPKELSVCDENNMTALHWASDRGYVEIIEFLISNNLDINKRDIDGQTPLHYASSCGHESTVKLLLHHGAKQDLPDSDNCLPYDVAENETIKQLLRTK